MKQNNILFQGNRGVAILIIMITLFLLIPTMLFVLNIVRQNNIIAAKDRQLNTTNNLANNMIIDIMGLLAQSQYDYHYDPSSLNWDDLSYKWGFSSMNVIPDLVNHTLFIEAKGRYGKAKDHALFEKTLYAVVQFDSPWTKFASMFPNGITTNIPSIIYDGPLYSKGDAIFTGTNLLFTIGPVIVDGNFFGRPSLTVDCDLYCSGNLAGGFKCNGTIYNFAPVVEIPEIDDTFYDMYSNLELFNGGYDIVFSVDPVSGDGRFSVNGGSFVTIPSSGYIIYGKKSTITVTGTVHGRVTIVATKAGTAARGFIHVLGDLVYANGTLNASYDDSIALIAENKLYMYKIVANNTVCGILISQTTDGIILQPPSHPSSYPFANTCGTHIISGTRNEIIKNGLDTTKVTCTDAFDENLIKYPPPGLPEKPRLVTWDFK
ncbi:MAG: hypothetical protein ABII27_08910 [bacterium]